MSKYQEAKRIVRDYFDAIENATHENVAEVLKAHTSE
ncbi:nuclear transport factor 2 family protein, partial [Vibrio splendidus]